MPPLNTYTFKHYQHEDTTITFSIYGDERQAKRRLTNYVINPLEWKLV